MNGIRTGTRLEQLYKLKTKIEHEIAQELRRNETSARPRGRVAADDTTRARLVQLGVTSRQVKAWAVATGRLPKVTRGRIARNLVEQYAQEHQGHW